MSTQDLIDQLSQDSKQPKRLWSPTYLAAGLILGLGLYGVGLGLLFGLRPHLEIQLARPMFSLELLILVLISGASVIAAVASMYPDAYQRPWLLRAPYILFAVFALFLGVQVFFMPITSDMVIPPLGGHGMNCALGIARFAFIPSAVIFWVIRRGASTHPRHAGAFAVFAAWSVCGLLMRLVEANDLVAHMALWHYLPTLVFAGLGAVLGRWLLRWA